MKTNDFNKVVDEVTEKIKSTLKRKASEYNLNDDRLSVFKHAGAMAEETPEKALYGFMLKHLISVTDMVNSEDTYSKELWNEKMTDIHCYLILLNALLQDTARMSCEQSQEKVNKK